MASKKLHAIIFPFPLQGHINPTVNLALKLATKGITVTFVNHESVHHKLANAHNTTANDVDLFPQATKSGLDIRYTTISDGLPLEFDRSLHFVEYLEVLYRVFPVLVDEFVVKTIKSEPFLVPFIVADTIYSWHSTISRKYNLVSVSFWTEPALVFSLCYHLNLLKEHGHFPCKDGIEEDISYVPGVESINTRDIMPYLKESESGTLVTIEVSMAFQKIEKVDFVLQNAVQELESNALSALSKLQAIYAIGPINFLKNQTATTVTKSLWSESDCTQWLDSKAPGSVLYVSFGSLVQTNKQVIEEVANGLLLSEVNFIWVIRSGLVSSDDSNVLPDGFEDEIKDRGLIVPWCNQIMVLSNSAVGGFLTHCGWNSILESIWCGVPMICYPIMYDQPVNRKLVVDDWKIGINLCDGTSIHREKVAEKIKCMMNGTISEGLKQDIKKVRATLHNAVEIGGSSENNFDQFIQDLKAKINGTAANA